MNLENFLNQKSRQILDSKPTIFNLNNREDREKLTALMVLGKVQHVVNDYHEQLQEYFQAKNPQFVYESEYADSFGRYCQDEERKAPLWQHGRWVFYPWIFTLVHILEEEAFQTVRTMRNKNLINGAEQQKFYNAVVGVAGLSVGNSVALSIVLQGGAKHIRLADFDKLSLSNTNRIRTGIDNLGLLKVEMSARQIYLLNPYAEVELFSEGLSNDNIVRFFEGPPKLLIVVDEIDNLAVKYIVREQAKSFGVALVMGADNGDNAVIDIERYDINPDQQFFHGRIGDTSYDKLKSLNKFGIGKTIAKHIGADNVTERVQHSLLEMGKTVVSWPQLGGAALINGSAVAYCVRKIVNGEPLEHNRAFISLDEKLMPNYNHSQEIKKRQQIAGDFKNFFGLS